MVRVLEARGRSSLLAQEILEPLLIAQNAFPPSHRPKYIPTMEMLELSQIPWAARPHWAFISIGGPLDSLKSPHYSSGNLGMEGNGVVARSLFLQLCAITVYRYLNAMVCERNMRRVQQVLHQHLATARRRAGASNTIWWLQSHLTRCSSLYSSCELPNRT